MADKPKAEKRLFIRSTKDPQSDYTAVELTYGKSGPNLMRLHQDDFADFIENLRHGFQEIVIKPN